MLIRQKPDISSSEITSEAAYIRRRDLLAGASAAGLAGLFPGVALAGKTDDAKLKTIKSKFSTDEQPSRFRDITSYNNFYEFGTAKSDPAYFANALTTSPWSLRVEGLAGKPTTFDVDDLINSVTLEERIYRLRCVEAWSMVVPWVGFPLSEILKRVDPLGNAKYVAFETLHRPSEMRGQRRPILKWPYVEGLRMDEAMHPLTILAVGLYGQKMPKQNGAPIRLVVPWKYGFKSIKSIVRLTLTEDQPPTSWNRSLPREYGFYSNVNPEVDHPRWSQARERRIGVGTGLFTKRQPTLMFNGYAEQVADLYKGMDLRKFF